MMNCTTPSAKFHSLKELQSLLAAEREAGRSIALANGCFDLIHVGHVRYLQEAASIADILVVALNSDDSLRRLKGARRGIFREDERVALISSLECVNYVTLFGQATVTEILLALKPDFHCKGSDYTPQTVPERDVVASYGGRIRIVGGAKVRSSSDILKSILALAEK